MIVCYLYLLLVLVPLHSILGEKILAMHPVYAGSHIYAVRKVLEELVNRGHQVNVIRWLESSNIPEIHTAEFSEVILSVNNSYGSIPFLTKEDRAVFEFPGKHMWKRGLNPISVFDGGMHAVAASCETLLQNTHLISRLKEQKYDVAVLDIIYNECGLALAHHLGIPVVGYWAFFFSSGEAQYTTAFNPPSVIPHTYSTYSSRMNFFQRIINFMYGIGSHLVMQVHFSYTDKVIQKYLPGTPPSSDLLSEISGMLINSHPSFDYPKQLPPSFFQIGGLHIKAHKSLQNDLMDFVDNANQGVILFSLGLNFDAESMPQDIFESYFKVFGSLKQKVIVRSNSNPATVPPNVKIMKHVPQCDILAHPNTVLFITHCGMHGVMEAIHHGVKMVGIPMFFDQGNVAARLKEKGVAVILDKTDSQSTIIQAINTVINDTSYEKNMKDLHSLYHHSLENPMTRAIWLIEHVMEFKGADHLKLDTRHYNFIQHFCIDVIAFLVLTLMVLCYLSLTIFYKVLLMGKKSKHKTQ